MLLEIGSYLILGFYAIALSVITIYCLMQFRLLIYYKRGPCNDGLDQKPLSSEEEEQFPFVTVQLPVYNEEFVVERLIDNIMELDYPKDRMEIHVLDDSSDHSLDLAKAKVEEYKKLGFLIEHITREDRVGFKAGALKYGMQYAKGDYIAIFDADFLPNKDFLKNTIPHFLKNDKIGVVQTRWEHINQDYSLITELQAFQLNVHFTVEQLGRRKGDLLLQFNGTAGVWRKETIEDAGGWEADTLTEDLDLSYRAQLKGWEIVFLEDIVSPAELPAEMNSLKSQQYRWMKGGAETAKKMLPTIWKSHLTLKQKIYGSAHLLGSSIFLAVFLIGLFSVPMLFIINPLGFDASIFGIFAISTLCIVAVYFAANVQKAWPKESKFKMILKFFLIFPLFLALSMGLSLHNSIAVIQGFLGKQSAFIRTPKFNIKNLTDKIQKNKYINAKLTAATMGEGFLTLYFVGGIALGLFYGDYSFFIFHLLLAVGYGTIFFLSIKHLKFK